MVARGLLTRSFDFDNLSFPRVDIVVRTKGRVGIGNEGLQAARGLLTPPRPKGNDQKCTLD